MFRDTFTAGQWPCLNSWHGMLQTKVTILLKKDDALRIVLDKYRANGCPCGGQVKLWPVLLDHYNRSCAVPPAASRYVLINCMALLPECC